MKNTMRAMSLLFALVLCIGLMAACGGNSAAPTTGANAPTTLAPTPTTEGTEPTTPFVAPPDQIGLVVSADTQIVTWNPYATEGDTIDFKSVNVKDLGMAGEMSLVYLEAEVSYYSLVSGKLEEATIYDVVSGSVIGITTLEEGVQEVYILSVPADESDDYEDDPLEELEEVTLPTEATEGTEEMEPDSTN